MVLAYHMYAPYKSATTICVISFAHDLSTLRLLGVWEDEFSLDGDLHGLWFWVLFEPRQHSACPRVTSPLYSGHCLAKQAFSILTSFCSEVQITIVSAPF